MSPTNYATKRVVFVDDEAANGRLGVRYLLKLGVVRDNITLLTDGWSHIHTHAHTTTPLPPTHTHTRDTVPAPALKSPSASGV